MERSIAGTCVGTLLMRQTVCSVGLKHRIAQPTKIPLTSPYHLVGMSFSFRVCHVKPAWHAYIHLCIAAHSSNRGCILQVFKIIYNPIVAPTEQQRVSSTTTHEHATMWREFRMQCCAPWRRTAWRAQLCWTCYSTSKGIHKLSVCSSMGSKIMHNTQA